MILLIFVNVIVTDSINALSLFLDFIFQAENDAVGQELQKQLEAAGGLQSSFFLYQLSA